VTFREWLLQDISTPTRGGETTVNPVTNLPAATLPHYLRQARPQGFTLVNLAVALFRLLAGFAAPRCLDKGGTSHANHANHANHATRQPS
jgi:hypothetical protein